MNEPTGRPPAHDELSTSLLRQLGEETGFLIWAATPNLERILFTSPAYERIWGHSRETLYADPQAFVEAIHPDDRESLLGVPFDEPLHALVSRVVRPDGSTTWIRSWRIPIRDDAGVVRQLIGLTEDITESRRVLADLEHRNRTLGALNEITRATLGAQSFDGLVADIAAHVAAAVGFPIVVIERDDPVHRTVVLEGAAGLGPAASRPAEWRPEFSFAREVARSGEPLVRHRPWEHSGHETLYGTRVGTVVAAPQVSGGRPVGALTIAHPDVVPVEPTLVAFVATLANHLAAVLARRRTEHALRASEQLFRDVAEHIHQAIVVIDVNTGLANYVSPGWSQTFQRDPALLARGVMALVEWIHPDDRPWITERLSTAVRKDAPPAGDRIQPIEFRIVRPDGSVRWLRARGNRIRTVDGTVTHVLGLAEDVTEEKERVADLEAAVARTTARVRELERHQAELDRMAMAGRMAARIAHEINNPLASIKNAFFLVRDALASSPERKQWAARIDREIDRIARIVRQMYELYRPEASHGRADVALTVVAATDVFVSEARERGIRIRTEVPVERHTVSVPESLLREVVAGVLQNAIEASPPNGEIRVEAKVGAGEVEVIVSDQGNGIPEALRDRVFEPFFTTKDPGVVVRGFGLTMVKSIVDALGGRVIVGDAPGGGACVRVRLPTPEARG